MTNTPRVHRLPRLLTCVELALVGGSPTACREARDANPLPANVGSPGGGAGTADSGRTNPTATGGEVLATVDGVAIDQETVDAWILGASSGGRREATPEARAAAINALIFEQLLQDKCAEVCGSGPPSPSGCACDAYTIEKTVTEALGTQEPTEAEIAAEYELQKLAWSSDSPWVALSAIAIPWVEPIGVPACDTLMAQAWRCEKQGLWNIAGKVETANELRRLMAASTQRATLAEECKRIRAEYVAETEVEDGEDCDWSSKAPIGDASKRIAHERIPDARAELSAAPGDAAAVHHWRYAIRYDPEYLYADRTILAIDTLPPALRPVVEQAKLGEPSPPVEISRAYWMVFVHERWPEGALPLEARRADITAEARDRLVGRAHEELPLRLRQGHEIVMHRYETEANALLPILSAPSQDSYYGGPDEENALSVMFEIVGAE